MRGRGRTAPNARRWMAAAQRGSILIASYFVIATLLGLTVPQTMRSMSAVQLETRRQDRQQLWYLAEAGLDEAIRHLFTKPDFGWTDDDGTSVWAEPSCIDDPGTAEDESTWDCWSPAGIAGTGTYTVRARDANFDPNTAAGKMLVVGNYQSPRHLRVTATSARTGDTATHEMWVQVIRLPAADNPNGSILSRGTLTIGADTIFTGDVTSHAWWADAVILEPNAQVQGQITVSSTKDNGGGDLPHDLDHLCCDSGDAIHVQEDATQPGSIRSTGMLLLASNQNGNGANGDIIAPGDAEAPAWNPHGVGLATTTSNVSNANCYPQTNRHRLVTGTQKFCQPGIGSAGCTAEGRTVTDGDGLETVEYCFDSLYVQDGAVAQFEGERVRIITRSFMSSGPTDLNGDPNSLVIGQGAKAYSFDPGDAAPTPPTAEARDLTFHTGGSIRVMPAGELYGSIYAPESLLHVGNDPADVTPLTVGTRVQGYAIAKDTYLRGRGPGGGALRIEGGGDRPGPLLWVRVMGWRRCFDEACEQ